MTNEDTLSALLRRNDIAGKTEVLEARSLIRQIASTLSDSTLSQKFEREMNDSYLRLQLGILLQNSPLVTDERRRSMRLLRAVQRPPAADRAAEPRSYGT